MDKLEKQVCVTEGVVKVNEQTLLQVSMNCVFIYDQVKAGANPSALKEQIEILKVRIEAMKKQLEKSGQALELALESATATVDASVES